MAAELVSADTRPGRSCPLAYRYAPSVFARPPELQAHVLYVAGGVYGNLDALIEIERMAALETCSPRLVFNGDFHWFDVAPELFAEVDRRVGAGIALRGNVETEIAADDDENGCGCAYPPAVADADVDRSNRIAKRLRETARAAECAQPHLRQRLAALPMHAVARVGRARIAVVHGDAWALAGWAFAHDRLHDGTHVPQIESMFEAAAVDVFACTHTCLPALKLLMTPHGERVIANNGAAGMPNFAGTRFGLLTRIATEPLPLHLEKLRCYGVAAAGVFIDALAIHFDVATWQQRFLGLWPAGSPAHASYWSRILQGPDFSVDDALGRAPVRNCVAGLRTYKGVAGPSREAGGSMAPKASAKRAPPC
ncbi:MAG TPA: hypothetical protein VFR86_21750 [Burkholderiaceae bacterium]|nr:hypothetical protein [Burkholderiaceae bacterium]